MIGMKKLCQYKTISPTNFVIKKDKKKLIFLKQKNHTCRCENVLNQSFQIIHCL